MEAFMNLWERSQNVNLFIPRDRWVNTLVSVGRDLSILPTGKRGLCWYTPPDNYEFTPED